MATHILHGDSSYDLHRDGLYGTDCDRCSELAEHPFETLDDRMLEALVQRINDGLEPRSANERTAMYYVRGAQRLNKAVS